jgi:hypothetical protein
VPKGQEVNGMHGGQWVDAEVLANFYASLYSSMEDAGSPPEEEEVSTANAELEPFGWAVLEREGGWKAVDLDEEEAGQEEEPGQFKRVKKGTPGAVWKDSKAKGGGHYIDAEQAAREKVRSEHAGKARKTTADRLSERREKGPLDRSAMAERLTPHAQEAQNHRNQEVHEQTRKSAVRSWKALQRIHGENAEYRLEEIAEQAEKALARTKDDTRKTALKKQLAKVHAMLGLAALAPEKSVPGLPPKKPEAGKVYNVAVDQLKVDPSRFQYKLNVNASGVTTEFGQVKTFNPDFAGVISVWKDPNNGETFVVNGHHRHELASRLGHPELAVRYVQAKDAQEARALGALVNIAEGRGTAIDAAKFMRDTGTETGDLEKYGVSLKGKVARDAAVLTKLNDRLFNRLATGRMEEPRALAIAANLPNPDLQDQLFSILEKEEEKRGIELPDKVVAEMAREMASTPTTTKKDSGGLFGDMESEESLFVPRNEIKSYVRGELAREVNDFLVVSSQKRAGRLAGEGNVINPEKNREIADKAEQAKNLFDTLVNRKGAISDAINQAAGDYSQAQKKSGKDAVRKQAVEKVRDAILRELNATTIGRPEERTDRGAKSQTDQASGGLFGAEPTAASAADAGRGGPVEDGLIPPHVQSALDRYDNRDSLPSSGGLFGGEDLRSRERFGLLPNGTDIVLTEGRHRGRTGKIVREIGPDGKERLVADVEGVEGTVPITPTAVEPLNDRLSWRTELGAQGRDQGGMFGNVGAMATGKNVQSQDAIAIQREINQIAKGGGKGDVRGVPIEMIGIGKYRVVVNGQKLEGDLQQVANWVQSAKPSPPSSGRTVPIGKTTATRDDIVSQAKQAVKDRHEQDVATGQVSVNFRPEDFPHKERMEAADLAKKHAKDLSEEDFVSLMAEGEGRKDMARGNAVKLLQHVSGVTGKKGKEAAGKALEGIESSRTGSAHFAPTGGRHETQTGGVTQKFAYLPADEVYRAAHRLAVGGSPKQHARHTSPLASLSRRARACGDYASAKIYQRQADAETYARLARLARRRGDTASARIYERQAMGR